MTPPRTPRREDLVLRALRALDEGERRTVDEALARDPALRERYDRIASHLLLYDRLPRPQAPAPVTRLLARLGAQDGEAVELPEVRESRPLLRWVAAAATVLLAIGAAFLAFGGPREGGDPDAASAGVLAHLGGHLEVADGWWRTADQGLGRVGDRTQVHLERGARLRVTAGDRVRLEEGRAWFDVEPRTSAREGGGFRVETPYGTVEVLGTAFEVDLTRGDLGVGVARGRVVAGDIEIDGGEILSGGALGPAPAGLGAWRERPHLALDPDPSDPLGRSVRLALENRGLAPLPLSADHGLLVRFEGPGGQPLDFPVHAGRPLPGAPPLPGEGEDALTPGSRVEWRLRFGADDLPPGPYRCTGFFRPPGRPAVVSAPIALEVR
jgi:ferric-dicitrate binding protein FerR (iron transport regulator)